MKKIPNPFDWYPSDFWYWPDHDEKLLQVIDQVHDLDQVLPLIPNNRVCIQAGGACGVWPLYLSLFFDKVYTFEPQPENYKCMFFNMFTNDPKLMVQNIDGFEYALGEKEYGMISMNLDESEKNNSGCFYCTDGDQNRSHSIDSMDFIPSSVDFICLDVEGFEEKALRGAAKTIDRCKPVIMIEEKPLPHLKPGEHLKAREFLESLGYKEVLKIHRDVVFKIC